MEAYMDAEASIYLRKNLQRQAAGNVSPRGAQKLGPNAPVSTRPEGAHPDPLILFKKPKPKGLTGHCFSCGQPDISKMTARTWITHG